MCGTGDVIGNVVYNCESGIEAGAGNKIIANNIVVATDEDPIKGGTDVRNNLFWQNGEQMDSSLGIEADPLFVNAANYDFRLKEGSPAIDKGNSDAIEAICDNFEKLYGVDLKYDYVYNKRPQGNGWDIGAYEYTGQIGIIPVTGKSKQYGIKVVQGKGSVNFIITLPENEKGLVAIYNPQGKCIKQYPLKQSMRKISFQWDVYRENSSGFYIVVLKTSSGNLVTKRFILTH